MGIRQIITREIGYVNNNFQDSQDLTLISDMATATKALYPANKQVITKGLSVVFGLVKKSGFEGYTREEAVCGKSI